MELPKSAVEQYRSQQRVSSRAAAVTKRLWSRVGDDFDLGWQRVRRDAAVTVSAAMADAVTLALPYTAAVLAETGQTAPAAGALVPDMFTSTTPYGTTVEHELDRAPIIAKLRSSSYAAEWLGATVLTLLADTRRDVYQADMMQRPTLTGYVRMLNPPSCSRCLILAGKWFRWNEGFMRHPRCDCQHIPAREDMAGDVRTDPYEYFNSLDPAAQDKLLGARDAQAVRDGADIYRVVNIRARGLGTAKANIRYGTPHRLTIDQIYERVEAHGGNRNALIRIMTEQGYITGPQVRGGNILGRFNERFSAPISRAITPGSARERVLRARATGVRDPLDRATMTAGERRIYDAWYRVDHVRRTGSVPTSIGANSMTRFERSRAATPGEIARVEEELRVQVASLYDQDGTARVPDSILELARLLDLI